MNKTKLRSLGLGRALYHLWYRPVGSLGRWWRQGFWLTWTSSRSRNKMRESALKLQCPATEHAPFNTPICFLTGDHYWEQTAYCLHSLERHLRTNLRTIIIDDGSLQPHQADVLKRIAPNLRVVPEYECASRLSEHLDISVFPTLHHLWHHYKHIRKLLDPHLLGERAVLVLDSDMLFQHRPEEIWHWLGNPEIPIVMRDCAESYGYTREQLRSICGYEVPPLINVGVTGLLTERIDWHQWESWCAALVGRFGMSYFLEQALVAMQLATEPHAILPADKYAVLADLQEARSRHLGLTLGHYVADSKPFYFQDAWRVQSDNSALGFMPKAKIETSQSPMPPEP